MNQVTASLRSTLFTWFTILLAAAPLIGCAGEFSKVLRVDEKKGDDGQVMSRETYYLDSSGRKLREGTMTEWYENGQKRLEIEYSNGRAHGSHIMWHPNGQVEMQGNWSDGRENGVWTWWDLTGQKSSECTYKNGKILGKRSYWDQGRLVREDIFDTGGERIEITTWYKDGTKRFHGTFRNGKKHGRWTYWNPEGTIQAEGEWQDGRPWEGVCGVPLAGDAGSLGGLEKFVRYKKGKVVQEKQ